MNKLKKSTKNFGVIVFSVAFSVAQIGFNVGRADVSHAVNDEYVYQGVFVDYTNDKNDKQMHMDGAGNVYIRDGEVTYDNSAPDVSKQFETVYKYSPSGVLLQTIQLQVRYNASSSSGTWLQPDYRSSDVSWSLYLYHDSWNVDDEGNIWVGGSHVSTTESMVGSINSFDRERYAFAKYSPNGGEPTFYGVTNSESSVTNYNPYTPISESQYYYAGVYMMEGGSLAISNGKLYLLETGGISLYDSTGSSLPQRPVALVLDLDGTNLTAMGDVQDVQFSSVYGGAGSDAGIVQGGSYFPNNDGDADNNYLLWRVGLDGSINGLVESRETLPDGSFVTRGSSGQSIVDMDDAGNIYVFGDVKIGSTLDADDLGHYTLTKYSPTGEFIEYLAGYVADSADVNDLRGVDNGSSVLGITVTGDGSKVYISVAPSTGEAGIAKVYVRRDLCEIDPTNTGCVVTPIRPDDTPTDSIGVPNTGYHQ